MRAGLPASADVSGPRDRTTLLTTRVSHASADDPSRLASGVVPPDDPVVPDDPVAPDDPDDPDDPPEPIEVAEPPDPPVLVLASPVCRALAVAPELHEVARRSAGRRTAA